MINKIIETLDKKSEKFMLIAFYLLSLVLNWLVFKIFISINLFPNKMLNLLIGIIIFLFFLIITLNFLRKVIIWVNIKPILTKKERENKSKELDTLIIQIQKIEKEKG